MMPLLFNLSRTFILTIIALLPALWASVDAAERRPNVVYIVIDNVDFQYLGHCYGGSGLTPHMDRIAERGVKFTRAYAPTPLCVPSRYTCLTGRYASRCSSPVALAANPPGPWRFSACELEANRPNVARVMKAAGYATGFVGKYHLEEEKYGMWFSGKEGSVFAPEADAWLKARNAWLVGRIRQRGFDDIFNAIDFRNSQFRGIDFEGVNHNMEAEVLGALQFIDRNRDKPFFLYLATHLLHLPLNPKLLLGDYTKQGRVTEGGLLSESPKVPMPSRKEIYETVLKAGGKTAQQFGIHWLDAGIGAVVDRLDQLKLLDNTLVIVFSDNNQRGKETIYEGGARVPLLMMWPNRFSAGQTCDKLVASIDFVPTIFDACGVAPAADMDLDGHSLVPLLSGQSTPWRDALLLENGHTRAVVTSQWKYLALRYPPDVQAKIDEVQRTGNYPKLTRKAEIFMERFKKTLSPEAWNRARNKYTWQADGNNYMKSIDNFPFMFDADQLFEVGKIGPNDNEQENVAGRPENAAVLAEMKQKLTEVLAPLDRPFGEFKAISSSSASTRSAPTQP
jgi:arylsulfatase A-like enzyme